MPEIDQIQAVLNHGVIDRARSKLGGSHTTVTYPPLDALRDVDESNNPVEHLIAPVDRLNAYIHISFCEFICPFCHYAKTYAPVNGERDDITQYLRALFKEFELRGDTLKGSKIDSLYIGGGTPTVLSETALTMLVDQTAEWFGVPDQFCVETSPITLAGVDGSKKMQILIGAGVNRVSLGVQTFDDQLLQRYRGHRQFEMLKGIERLISLGISFNIDLIQDLPDQSAKSLDEDLRFIERYQPDQVTWYIMRPAPDAPWYKSLSRGSLQGVPASKDSAERRIYIIEAMEGLGYELQAGGRFKRTSSDTDHFKHVRGGLDTTLLGFGVSSYSHGWGYFFRNTHDHRIRDGIRDYISRMESGVSPISEIFQVTENEARVSKRVVGVRTHIKDDLLQGDHRDDQDARMLTTELCEAGLLHKGQGPGVQLTPLGRAFEEEISTLFYSRDVINTLQKRDAFWRTGH